MKKLFKSLMVLVLCVCTCLSFAGCGEVKWSETTNNNANVVSNGGATVYHNGWLYFINGTKTVNEQNNTGENVQAGIYRVQTDAQGNVLYKETTAKAKDDKEVKEFKNMECLVQNLAGFDNGSLFIFGDYLYYATPSKGKNDEGTMLTGKTAFMRYDIVNKQNQTIYTTKASDDTVNYTYYKQGATLNLVVFEKNSATLTSIKVGDKMETRFQKTDVVSVAMSNNFGDVVNSGTNVTDCYVYFTMSAEKNKEGNRVFRILPDGNGEKLLSENEEISLLTVAEGYLVYQNNEYTYANKIKGNDADSLPLDSAHVVYYSKFDNQIFVEENGRLGAIVYNKGVIQKIVWDENKSIDENVESFEPIFDEFDSSDKVKFVGLDGDYLIYQLSKYIYKVKVLNVTASDELKDIKLTTTKLDEPKDGSLMGLEIVNGYVYGMYTDTTAKTTYMYRVRIQTPEEAGEVDKDGKVKEVGDAEFIGIKE